MSNTNATVSSLRLGSRTSDLALWQTRYVRDLLQAAWPSLELTIHTLSTQGDRLLNAPLPLIGGKGLFTAELEAALHGKVIDLAVHSLKDLPTEPLDGLAIGAVPRRANPADVLVSRRDFTLETLPTGAVVGTSSRRRAAQLLHLRPDLRPADIRGNVPTRIRKALDPHGDYAAIVLAYAGLERLGRLEVISQVLPFEQMSPAPGQGALGVQCRDEAASLKMVAPLDHPETRAAVNAERAFLAGLGGGCAVPVAARATIKAGQLNLEGRVTSPDGSRQIDVYLAGDPAAGDRLGADLARLALDQGAAQLLEPDS